jgi:hypothetical protein
LALWPIRISSTNDAAIRTIITINLTPVFIV